MKVVLSWVGDPLVHVILIGIALVYGFTGGQGEETRHVTVQSSVSLDIADGVIEDMSPPIIASSEEIVHQN